METQVNSQEEFNKLPPETQTEFIAVAKTEIAEGLKDKEHGAGKLEKLHKQPWLPDEIKEELGNASKVRNRNLIARRTCITNLAKAGLPIPIIQRISGHRTLKALMVYLKQSNEESAAMVQQFWDKQDASIALEGDPKVTEPV